jgi:hypothetical protein
MESEHFDKDKKDEAPPPPIPTFKESKSNNATIGRLALSKNICRFELPMDMLLFESKRN